ncbi:hypothetical protein BDV29DRAFT_172529 [Aspergillus leporis]|jgi:hypothetical protein|uniref:Uncharacterized protein n=1 Tax=Aspergillus leporis TaxID=41062 RepID=A0A5N5X2W4_9EURO|nr:hypothetical protein BDV29DRAFT_172529 [Aspergillus leporis]
MPSKVLVEELYQGEPRLREIPTLCDSSYVLLQHWLFYAVSVCVLLFYGRRP